MSPRIEFEAIDEFRSRDQAFYEKPKKGESWGELVEKWQETWEEAAGGSMLPSREDAYSQTKILNNPKMSTLIFIDSDREREIGIGEKYELGPIPPTICWRKAGWLLHEEVTMFSFRYDYQALVD